jgi:transposase
MDTSATYTQEYSPRDGTLFAAFELSWKGWRLAFTTGLGQAPRLRGIGSGDLAALERELTLAKRRFRLAEGAPVMSCYEAGRDGFWLHRYLMSQGIHNHVVDSASIEVNRRQRRIKTDRLDAGKLVTMLVRSHAGDDRVWRVVCVPPVEAEDGRQLQRELESLKQDRTRYINRLKGLLATQGVRIGVDRGFLQRLESVCLWDGSPLPPLLKARLAREYERLQFVQAQIREVERERKKLLEDTGRPEVQMVRGLMRLKSIGVETASTLVVEFFGWRSFRSRRQVAALAGLTPTASSSGETSRELGISKSGNRRLRWMMIELAWGWLRYQPNSDLSRWYQRRFGGGGPRMRRIGIVALARRLLVDVWKYLDQGVIPQGAEFKA